MCGLAGFVLKGTCNDPRGTLRAMGGALVHRGPDDEGLFFDPQTGLGMVHRRLSIIDLSQKGHQPMVSDSGRYRMVYNGEVYNYPALRQGLGTHSGINGDGDSALILEAFDALGIEEALKTFRGMFAMAVQDQEEGRLVLARDTLGIKPLYYGTTSRGTFLFGSELRALVAHPHFDAEVDPGAIHLLLRFGNIPQPNCIYTDIEKLPPGHMVSLPLDGEHTHPNRPIAFRSPLESARKGWEHPFRGSFEDAKSTLHEALRASVQEHLVSDVPLGAFLSGGVDSSLVCALAQNQGREPLKTFTIGFEERDYDEARHARQVAEHLGTDHHELTLDPKVWLEQLPNMVAHLDEPFADSSFLPTSMVSQMTRQHVTVSLSGDGADELFGGYDRYRWTPMIWDRLSPWPRWLQRWVGGMGQQLSPGTWEVIGKGLQPWLPKELQGPRFGNRIHRVAGLMGAPSSRELYQRLMTHFGRASEIFRGTQSPLTLFDHDEIWRLREDLGEKMMLMDLLTYLCDDILTKVDRASMASSLENRVPLLTPELVELAWSFPPEWRREKFLLKEVLYKYVPPQLTERPKKGFAVPLGSWLRGPLRAWAEDLLHSKGAKEEEWLDGASLGKIWKDHLLEKSDRSQELWTVLCYLQWQQGH